MAPDMAEDDEGARWMTPLREGVHRLPALRLLLALMAYQFARAAIELDANGGGAWGPWRVAALVALVGAGLCVELAIS